MSAFDENPWSRGQFNITAQGQYILRHGLPMAKAAARAAGVDIGATKPAAETPPKQRPDVFILNKTVKVGNSGGSGSSGYGPPTG